MYKSILHCPNGLDYKGLISSVIKTAVERNVIKVRIGGMCHLCGLVRQAALHL